MQSESSDYARDLDDIISLHETWTYNLGPETEQYAIAIDQLTKLRAMKETPPSTRPSPDTVLTMATHLAGILLIVAYEQRNVWTSKAMSFLSKAF